MNGDASIRNRHKLKLTITGFRLEGLGFSLWVVAFLALKMGPVQREREGETEPPNRRVRPALRSQAKPGGNRPQPKGVGALSEELDLAQQRVHPSAVWYRQMDRTGRCNAICTDKSMGRCRLTY